jgi:hypothetical protein
MTHFSPLCQVEAKRKIKEVTEKNQELMENSAWTEADLAKKDENHKRLKRQQKSDHETLRYYKHQTAESRDAIDRSAT